jgi:hypothetical protein
MTRRLTAKTHFVPKIIFKTTFAGVVPLCVAATACGGKVIPGGTTGVANMAFGDAGADAEDAGAGVSLTGFGVGIAAFGDGGNGVGSVACIGFGGEPCGVGATVASAGFGDGGLIGPPSVAIMAFGDGGDTIDAANEPPDAHLLAVACIGFGGEPCGATDDAGGHYPIPAVAEIGFAVRSKG